MTKKTVSKIIAAVMVVSMCLTAVFTGAVSAAEQATCEVEGYKYNPGVTDEYVTYEVTFKSDTKFTAGKFTVDCPDELTFVACSYAHYGKNEKGDAPQVHVNLSGKKVLFAGFTESSTKDMHDFNEITLLLRFKPDTKEPGDEWAVSIKDISITNSEEAEYTCANAQGTAHVHKFDDTIPENTNNANGVTTTKCSVQGCTAVNTTIASNSDAEPNDLVDTEGLKYANITFAADGDVVLNALLPKATYESQSGTVYFVYRYSDGVNAAPAVATITGESTTIGGVEYYAFPCGRNAGIGRMARDVKGNFVVVNGNTVTKSAEWSYSVKRCLEDLIADSSKSDAVKNYAKALWNYGKYTTAKLATDEDTSVYYTADAKLYGDDKGDFVNDPAWPTDLSKSNYTPNAAADTWKVSKISVTTGYTPKINFKLNEDVTSVTFKLYSDASKNTLVYSKDVDVNGKEFTVTDIPAKYLQGEFEVSVPGSEKVFNYSITRYANARDEKPDGDIFKWMVKYSQYLSIAFDKATD